MRYIKRFCYGRLKSPLSKPYALSFATISSLDLTWVYIEDNYGRGGVGEAVALPGYSWESADSIFSIISSIANGAEGLSHEELVKRCLGVRAKHPFAASAVVTALEMPEWLNRTVGCKTHIPLAYPVSSEQSPSRLIENVSNAVESGYKFVKMKVGKNPDQDLQAVKLILNRYCECIGPITLDANQAYSVQESLYLIDRLGKAGYKNQIIFEQPTSWDNWNGLKTICTNSDIPIILDESIYSSSDIYKAAEIGANGVKLKICKNFGFLECISLAEQANKLGLAVVIGNGVASDISNMAEYLIVLSNKDLFSFPAECNGYLKLEKLIAFEEMGLNSLGAMNVARTNISLRLLKGLLEKNQSKAIGN